MVDLPGPLSIPSWWPTLILVFAAYRLTRLVGWDDWPPIAKARAWLIGEHWVPTELDPDELGLPGKQPSSQVAATRPAYRRPTLAHLIHCPFCLGWWIGLAWYGFWLGAPTAAVFTALPFAIAGAASLIARNWDP